MRRRSNDEKKAIIAFLTSDSIIISIDILYKDGYVSKHDIYPIPSDKIPSPVISFTNNPPASAWAIVQRDFIIPNFATVSTLRFANSALFRISIGRRRMSLKTATDCITTSTIPTQALHIIRKRYEK